MDKTTDVIISWVTCLLTILVLLPQVIKSFYSNNTDSLSVTFLILQFISSLFWVIYAFVLVELPMIISMSFYLLFSIMLLGLKFVHMIIRIIKKIRNKIKEKKDDNNTEDENNIEQIMDL
tara:strand:- start:188 stop:547 length:360 start_codon:yes stop_codon:yes gene_type:complete